MTKLSKNPAKSRLAETVTISKLSHRKWFAGQITGSWRKDAADDSNLDAVNGKLIRVDFGLRIRLAQ